ncbi:hypothetical protein [Streptococcus uberis]|uniref:hypothetical protein n=1 Tax=Streptococcus uberis TaxID=1349 RepID=UPI001939FE6D|nr:hypothetical protein [Streptococcus uberis]MCK1189274.1 hypothetical protein [Streptococcus uberis]MCK1202257.1 hypothetical protein [Streptococcus uberis]MCK1243140.1 hypothetical protein [Streptococcus uberis]
MSITANIAPGKQINIENLKNNTVKIIVEQMHITIINENILSKSSAELTNKASSSADNETCSLSILEMKVDLKSIFSFILGYIIVAIIKNITATIKFKNKLAIDE